MPPRDWRSNALGDQIQDLGGSRGGLAGLVGALRKGGLGGGMNPGDSPIGGRGWAGLNPGVGGYTDYPGGGREIPMPKLPGGPIGWGMRDTPPGLIGRSSEPDYGTGPRIGRSSEPDYGTGLPTQFDAGGRSGAQLRSDWAALDPTAQTAAYKQFQTASPEMQASVLAATGVDAQGNVLPTPGSYTGGGIKQLRGNSKAFNAMGAPTQASARPSSQDLMGMMGPGATADFANTPTGSQGGGDGTGVTASVPSGNLAGPSTLGGGGGLQGLAGPQGRPQPNRRPSSQDIMSMYG